MEAKVEIFKLNADVVTTSDCNCDFGCPTDIDQMAE